MAVLKCKLCGKGLRLPAGVAVYECEYCGARQGVPHRSSDQGIATLYECANHFWKQGEFDRATIIYKQILGMDREDAEAHWSIALCKFCVNYIEDPDSHIYVPEVYSDEMSSFDSDDNYKEALRLAAPEQGDYYESEAKAISSLQLLKGYMQRRQAKPAPAPAPSAPLSIKKDALPLALVTDPQPLPLASEPKAAESAPKETPLKLKLADEPRLALVKDAPAAKEEGPEAASMPDKKVTERYTRALSLVDSRDLNDLHEARNIFSDLSGYRNADAFVERCDNTIKEVTYEQAQFLFSSHSSSSLQKAEGLFRSLGNYLDSEQMVANCLTEAMEADYQCAQICFEDAKNVNDYNNAMIMLKKLGDYRDSKQMAERCEEFVNDASYNSALAIFKKAKTDGDWQKALSVFQQLGEFRDSQNLVIECQVRIKEFREQQIRTAKKMKRLSIAISVVLTLGIVAFISYDPLMRYLSYQKGIELMQSQQYAEAKEKFSELGEYSDCAEKIVECQDALNAIDYKRAEELIKKQDFAGAQKIFASLGDYRDSKTRKDNCLVGSIDSTYDKAKKAMSDGKYAEAQKMFASLGEYRDSLEQSKGCEYELARQIMDKGDYQAARQAFLSLVGFRDSSELLGKCAVKLFQKELAKARKGDTVSWGKYLQKDANTYTPIPWVILEHKGDSVMLISKDALDSQMFHSDSANPVTWESSQMRHWLNGEFLNVAFSKVEQAYILTTKLKNGSSNIGQHEVSGGADTSDRVFLLSCDEVTRLFRKENKRLCELTDYATARGTRVDQMHKDTCSWWLRSPGADTNTAARIDIDGSIGYDRVDVNYGVRPVLWVKCASK